ncbi:MAG: tRNA pseudouridine(38-40) synthase TruA [Planctomycetota bacterium]
MRYFRLVLEYDGTDFHGWQDQDGTRTVEGCLRTALAPLSRGSIETLGASRTDAGVHARGQCARIALETELTAEALTRAIAARVPADMGLVSCQEVTEAFHPRFLATEKRYLYRLASGPRPPVFGRRWAWWHRGALDLELMNRAALRVVGRFDFAGFRNRSKDEPDDTVREIRVAKWLPGEEGPFFQVIGTGFLYKMVRNLVGTLVDVGRGRLDPGVVDEMLATQDRTLGGPTAPPQGLHLMEVAYPDTSCCALADRPPCA